MPRELRKRGKKHKKSSNVVDSAQDQPQSKQEDDHQQPSAEPSWIISAPQVEDAHPEAPFGYVDPDVKAYFRTVDEQIRTWQEDEHHPEDENEDLDPNEGEQLNPETQSQIFKKSLAASCSKASIFCCCAHRDVRERKATCYRSRLFSRTGAHGVFNG